MRKTLVESTRPRIAQELVDLDANRDTMAIDDPMPDDPRPLDGRLRRLRRKPANSSVDIQSEAVPMPQLRTGHLPSDSFASTTK